MFGHFTQEKTFGALFQDPHEMSLVSLPNILHLGITPRRTVRHRGNQEQHDMTNLRNILAAVILSTSVFGAALADPTTAPTPAPAAAPATGSHTLTVTVSGVRSSQGTIRAQLMMADYTAGTAKGIGGNFVSAVQGTTTLTFNNLADGDYSVQMFHDEDGNGEMKTNVFGIPSEGFAFSNGARAAFGPPKFADMKVTVRANTVTVANMAY
jgi:uncharacterized protein (DUF2141 family)